MEIPANETRSPFAYRLNISADCLLPRWRSYAGTGRQLGLGAETLRPEAGQ